MKNCVEIRWHGRGGQGAKTAALLLADVAFKTGRRGYYDFSSAAFHQPATLCEKG